MYKQVAVRRYKPIIYVIAEIFSLKCVNKRSAGNPELESSRPIQLRNMDLTTLVYPFKDGT
jgi:hypothetical protein